jgi:acyl CoA:acetate/3-ketoacid CoA transferase beta subunit
LVLEEIASDVTAEEVQRVTVPKLIVKQPLKVFA